jgi:hypothetical protein
VTLLIHRGQWADTFVDRETHGASIMSDGHARDEGQGGHQDENIDENVIKMEAEMEMKMEVDIEIVRIKAEPGEEVGVGSKDAIVKSEADVKDELGDNDVGIGSTTALELRVLLHSLKAAHQRFQTLARRLMNGKRKREYGEDGRGRSQNTLDRTGL